MIIYSEENVYHAALNRIRFLYDEFPNIVATWSGGKDSTVVMNLCLEVAKEKNRLPLDVFWIDQEFEWNSTVDYARIIKKNTDIRFHWMQVPLAYDNATSNKETKIISWDPQKQWMREKEPDSIQDGDYGIEGFFKAFQRWQDHVFGNDKVCLVGGLRV
jgi:predicted phosphoadenosine phosphosulfate sulfurtransferase